MNIFELSRNLIYTNPVPTGNEMRELIATELSTQTNSTEKVSYLTNLQKHNFELLDSHRESCRLPVSECHREMAFNRAGNIIQEFLADIDERLPTI